MIRANRTVRMVGAAAATINWQFNTINVPLMSDSLLGHKTTMLQTATGDVNGRVSKSLKSVARSAQQ